MNDSGLGDSPQFNDDVEAVEMRSTPSTTNSHTASDGTRHTLKTPLSRTIKSALTSSVAEQIHELEGIDKSLLFRQLRPLFSCMCIFGIYFKHQSKENGRQGLLQCLFHCSLHRLYCIGVNAILLFYLTWSLVAFRVCSSSVYCNVV